MKKIYIHIGCHKTGSTSLQHFFYKNKNIFLKNNIYIPKAMQLADLLRKELGVAVYVDSLRRSMKSQMRHANKMNAKFIILEDLESIDIDTPDDLKLAHKIFKLNKK